MEQLRGERVLEEWAAVSGLARPPGIPVASADVDPRGLPRTLLATAAAVLLLVSGAWWTQRPGVSPGSVNGSPPPSTMLGPANWWLDPSAVPLPDDATVLPGWIREMSCASGASPQGRVTAPTIEYGPVAIMVRFEVQRVPEATCPSNPPYRVEIRLAEPVGGRILLDGSMSPPRDATLGDPDAHWREQPVPSLPATPAFLVTESPVTGGGPIRHCVALSDWWGTSPMVSVWTTRDLDGCLTRSSSIWTPDDIGFDRVSGMLRYRFEVIPDGQGSSELRLGMAGGRMILVERDGREVPLRPATNLNVPEG